MEERLFGAFPSQAVQGCMGVTGSREKSLGECEAGFGKADSELEKVSAERAATGKEGDMRAWLNDLFFYPHGQSGRRISGQYFYWDFWN